MHFGQAAQYDLLQGISIPPEYQTGKVKLRISYGVSCKDFTFRYQRIN